MIRRWVLLAVALAVLTAACGKARGDPAPPTAEVLRPEIIGLMTQWDYWDGVAGRYTLDTGEVVELNVGGVEGQPAARRLSVTDIYTPYGQANVGEPVTGPSVLLLVGHDADGVTWYAAAEEKTSEGLWGEPCPFEIRGAGVYDEGTSLHFSTGLLLPKSQTFKLKFDYDNMEEFPLRGPDPICIDRSGTALWAGITLQGH